MSDSTGHVVMETGTSMTGKCTKDFEVIARDQHGVVMSVQNLSRDRDAIRRHYKGRSGGAVAPEKIVKIFASRQDNSAVSYPPGVQFEWKSQASLLFEYASRYFIFVFPILMMLIGGIDIHLFTKGARSRDTKLEMR